MGSGGVGSGGVGSGELGVAKTSNVGKTTGGYRVTVTDHPPVEYVAKRSIQVKFDQAWLENEADVDRYLVAMREAFMAEIQQNKRISI